MIHVKFRTLRGAWSNLSPLLCQLSVQHSERALSDGGGSGGRIMFQGVLDQEKRVLVEKICSLKRDMARYEERVEFFESHSHQLTEDIQRKSKSVVSLLFHFFSKRHTVINDTGTSK